MDIKLISKHTDECKTDCLECKTLSDIDKVRVKYLGKNGIMLGYMKQLKDIPKEDKPKFGKLLNDIKNEIELIINENKEKLLQKADQNRLLNESIDVSLPGKKDEIGALHPLTQVKEQIIDIFIGLGFEVKQGPEIETDYYNFQALNIPQDHPARAMQDTFFINDNLLLRTHTSPMQIRVMEKAKPPIRMINPGKVYRLDDDATHSPMFQQIEGLVVDKKVTLCDLKGVLEEFAKQLFSSDAKVRFRPSYFPFTEPSVEVDVSCAMCGGDGCRLCKNTGWMEILGAGIVNPQVLKNCNIDPEEYSGFAFGMGIERIAMIKYGIPDMRILFGNSKRFLKQYK